MKRDAQIFTSKKSPSCIYSWLLPSLGILPAGTEEQQQQQLKQQSVSQADRVGFYCSGCHKIQLRTYGAAEHKVWMRDTAWLCDALRKPKAPLDQHKWKSEGKRWSRSAQDQPEKSTIKAAHNPILFFNLQKPIIKRGTGIRNASKKPFFHISHKKAQENTAPHPKITTMLLLISTNWGVRGQSEELTTRCSNCTKGAQNRNEELCQP